MKRASMRNGSWAPPRLVPKPAKRKRATLDQVLEVLESIDNRLRGVEDELQEQAKGELEAKLTETLAQLEDTADKQEELHLDLNHANESSPLLAMEEAIEATVQTAFQCFADANRMDSGQSRGRVLQCRDCRLKKEAAEAEAKRKILAEEQARREALRAKERVKLRERLKVRETKLRRAA